MPRCPDKAPPASDSTRRRGRAGGSESGVLTRNYLATTRTNRPMVVSLVISDPRTTINDPERAAALHALAAGAFQLMAPV